MTQFQMAGGSRQSMGNHMTGDYIAALVRNLVAKCTCLGGCADNVKVRSLTPLDQFPTAFIESRHTRKASVRVGGI